MIRSTVDALTALSLGLAPEHPLSRADIDWWQDKRLTALLSYCRKRSPYYRRTLAGFPDQIGMEELARLPLLTSDELRHHGAEMLCTSQDAIARIITLHSSGTTGPPKRLAFTENDLERTLAFFQHGMRALVRPGDRAAILLAGTTPDSTGHLLIRALERMQVRSRCFWPCADPAALARELAALQPHTVVAMPVHLLAAGRMARSLGLSNRSIRTVLLSADTIPETVVTGLGELFDCEVFSHYGSTESGLGGAVDCSAHVGMHLREADLLAEIIDPKSKNPLPEGAWGELVLTTLGREGMPLVRYQSGDLARLLPGRCPCGSPLRRLDRVQGRLDQIRLLENGEVLSLADLDEALFALPGLLDYMARIDRQHGRDVLHLALVPVPGREQALADEARTALAGLPACAGLRLETSLSPICTIQPGKRTLADQREVQPCNT